MKSWLKKNVFQLCNACLGYTVIYYFGSRSLVLFGEPEFPVED